MIPVGTAMSETDTLPTLSETEFTIGDPRWVMRSMADLYSNRELAVTREYSTNARDEHIKYGVDRPIEVTLPSQMNPNFRVRDYGIGMSEAVLKEVYTKFGTSTKQDSNDFNGMLGFGSKSAIAYTTTFTVVSIYQGIKTTAVITRRPDYSIVLKIVALKKSDEPSGTEIVIPVHNWNEFSVKAKHFYRFWRPGTVNVNGKASEWEVGEKLTDNLYYSPDADKSYVVMGNVAYRIENSSALFYNRSMRAINFVAYVDNGTVEFTPSREDLKYTDHTKATLHQVVADFEKEMTTRARHEIAVAKNHYEAFIAWTKWTDALGHGVLGDLTYKGEKLVATFPINGTRYNPNAYGYSTREIQNHDLSSLPKTLIITDYQNVLSSTHKAKAREYAQILGRKFGYFIFTKQKKIDSVWVGKEATIDWETLKAALPAKPKKVRVGTNAPGRIKGTFDYWTENGWVYEKDIPANKTVYFVRVKEANDTNIREIIQLLKLQNVVVVSLAANRIDKFTRENPSAGDFLEHARKSVVKDGPSLIPSDAATALSMNAAEIRWCESLKRAKIDDPRFAQLSNLRVSLDTMMEPYNSNMRLAILLGMWYNGEVKQHSYSRVGSGLLKDYPLLEHISYGASSTEIAIYINAVYAAKKGN